MPPVPRPIQVLPENVVHKIAAGEVVERPVSVVKELVENSLDAGATRIHVSLEQGGAKSIVVADDGHGIPPRDLPLALKRHATSKITRAEELFALHTLGFRGEALPSIASISEFRLESATAESDPVGYAVDVKGGKVGELQELPMSRGTRISVKELFCTTPARLKFLKRPETEWSHVLDLLTAMALHHLAVEWRLEHNGKVSLFCPAADDPKRRILDLFGRETMERLYPVERKVSELSIRGLIGHPNFSKRTNRQIYVFVNGRFVQDRLINHAVVNGYRGLLMTQQYPMAVLHLEVDPAKVDVNVHPTKREVRFSNSNVVHHLISETLRHALDRAPWREAESAEEGGKVALAVAGGFAFAELAPRQTTLGESFREEYARGIERALRGFAPGALGAAPAVASPSWREAPKAARIGALAFSELRLIGQLNATYLVCESEGSLLLVDQHAAHERIGFEQLKRSYLGGPLPQQRLLQPLSFDLPEHEAARLRACLPRLEAFGFAVDEFGEGSFVLKAHPTLLRDGDWVAVLREIAEEMEESSGLAGVEDRIDHVLATMACHRQIRAHQRLTEEEMLSLLRELEGTPRSYHCPHGRPVMVEVEAREIEKWFKRVL
ncbi:MAG: DNA mismatch repair endonuclease MutL [Deltaproteobacteria bacterium]|nr:DNA mismatch repair endonuclease MutL [Deltaproteobacteria bacterium]